MIHIPVLLNEVIENLNPKLGQKYIDATINGGGHAKVILDRILPDGELLGIELDLQLFKKSLLVFKKKPYVKNITIIHDSYVRLVEIADRKGFMNADGILLDLGMSSWHIEESGKGFSYNRLEPLDMRFHNEGLTAADILNTYSRENLEFIISEYGGEKFARKISQEIMRQRKNKPLESTFDLVEAIKESVPPWYRKHRKHFATKTFQSIRIEVNQEIKNIKLGLKEAIKTIKSGGRIAVISFHSLEDKIIKNQFRKWGKEGLGKIITKKPTSPSRAEIRDNIRSRSAKLRVFQKI